MKLIFNRQNSIGTIDNGVRPWTITEPPALPFEYDGIFYSVDRQEFWHMRAGGHSPLSEAEKAAVADYIAQQTAPEIVPNLEAEEKALQQAVQDHLDETARTRDYNDILSLCSYVNSTDETFAAEAAAGIAWRDAVWAYCKQVRADVAAQTRTLPTWNQLLTELPTIQW